jgi:hypothetical protein
MSIVTLELTEAQARELMRYMGKLSLNDLSVSGCVYTQLESYFEHSSAGLLALDSDDLLALRDQDAVELPTCEEEEAEYEYFMASRFL